MPPLIRWGLPSLFLLVGLGVAFFILSGTVGNACSETPRAFSHGVKTRQSTTLDLAASHCEVTDRSTHKTVENTVVNWPGLVTAITGCVAAWLLGASITGLVDRRRGLLTAGALLVVAMGSLAVFFL